MRLGTTRWLLVGVLCLGLWPMVAASAQETRWVGIMADAHTAIVAVRTGNEIVVGADSLALIGTKSDRGTLVCKIGNVGTVFFAVSGLLHDRTTGFSITQVIERAAEKATSPREIANEVKVLALRRLPNMVANIRHEDPQYFMTEIRDKIATSVLVFGVEEGQVALHWVGFRVREVSSTGLLLESESIECPGRMCPSNGPVSVRLGRHDAIDAFLEQNPGIWKIGLVDAVRELVELQIEATPSLVNGPIDIIRVTREGHEWIQRKEQCEGREE